MSQPVRGFTINTKRKEQMVKPVEQKVTEMHTEFMKRAQAEQQRMELVTDSEYWFCVCFETREQKEALLAALGLLGLGDKYLDGREVARTLGVDPGDPVTWPKAKGLAERLKKHL